MSLAPRDRIAAYRQQARSLIELASKDEAKAAQRRKEAAELFARANQSERDFEAHVATLLQPPLPPPPDPIDEHPRCPAPCGKRQFRSERAAMAANRTNGHSMRVYFSTDCMVFHVAKAN